MVEKGVIECEYFKGDKLCKAIIEDDEGKRVREESCVNESKDSCCYLCADRKSCEVSCRYLDKPIDMNDRVKAHVDQVFIGEYLGGHPAFPKKSNVHLVLETQNLVVQELELSIPYRNIKRIENMTKDKITATRVILLGIVGALWKKEQLYMVLTYRDKAAGNDLSMVFKMEKIEKAQPLIYQKMVKAKVKK